MRVEGGRDEKTTSGVVKGVEAVFEEAGQDGQEKREGARGGRRRSDTNKGAAGWPPATGGEFSRKLVPSGG